MSVPFLGTIFSSGSIHVWCSSVYLQQCDSVQNVGLNQNRQECVFMDNNRCSMTQRKKLYLAEDTHNTCQQDQPIVDICL